MSDLAENKGRADLLEWRQSYFVQERLSLRGQAFLDHAIALADAHARRPLAFIRMLPEVFLLGVEGEEQPHHIPLIGAEALWVAIDQCNGKLPPPPVAQFVAEGVTEAADIVRRSIREQLADYFQRYCPELERVALQTGTESGLLIYRPLPGERHIITRDSG